jgi:hypothetical protein
VPVPFAPTGGVDVVVSPESGLCPAGRPAGWVGVVALGDAAIVSVPTQSVAFVVREHGRVIAAAGYRAWPRWTVHVCVLTAPAARGGANWRG